MWRRWGLGLMLLGLAGCAMGGGACRLTLATVVPMQEAPDGHFLVPAEVAGRKVRLVVDTGSAISLVDPAVARGMGWAGPDVGMAGIGGSTLAGTRRLRVRLGRLTGQVMVVALPTPVAGTGVQGLLGMDVLGAYDVDIDWPGRQLRLFLARGDCARPVVAMRGAVDAVPFAPNPMNAAADMRPRVRVAIGGRKLMAVVDSGTPQVTLTRSAGVAVGLSRAVLAQDRVQGEAGIGPRVVAARRHVLAALRLGRLTVRHVRAIVLGEDLPDTTEILLGADLLRLIHVWLSNSSHTMVMEYPPLPSPALTAAGQGGR